MTVVDIKDLLTDYTTELIEISSTFIYYAKEKNEKGHNSLFITEYNRTTQKERIVATYQLSNRTFVQHYFSFSDDILIVMENAEDHVWVLRLNKQTGEERNYSEIPFYGDFVECKALDESHILFYTCENQCDKRLFQEYEKITGVTKIAYLYDLQKETLSYIKDPRICGNTIKNIIPYDVNGETQLLILQPYAQEEEKERCYENRRWLGKNICDSVWICSLIDFVVGVKSAESHLPLNRILHVGTDGLARFVGMDEYNLYFRLRHFPTNDQRICAVSKATVKKEVIAELNLEPYERNAQFFADTHEAKIYKITEYEDCYSVCGVLNSAVHTQYSKEIGEFVACIDDQVLVTRCKMTDEKDSFEFYAVYDIEKEKSQSYDCQCCVKGSTLVLY